MAWRTIYAAVLLGLSAYWLAKGIGIPNWRDGWDVGDATDIGVSVALAILALGSRFPTPAHFDMGKKP